MPDTKAQLTFSQVVAHCAAHEEFVEQYERLSGNTFGFPPPRSPIEVLVDAASDVPPLTRAQLAAFAAWVYEFVWVRLPVDLRDGASVPRLRGPDASANDRP